jgi:hypothetical protein
VEWPRWLVARHLTILDATFTVTPNRRLQKLQGHVFQAISDDLFTVRSGMCVTVNFQQLHRRKFLPSNLPSIWSRCFLLNEAATEENSFSGHQLEPHFACC